MKVRRIITGEPYSPEAVDTYLKPFREADTWLTEHHGALIRIAGSDHPDALTGTNPDRKADFMRLSAQASANLSRATMGGTMSRVVAAAAAKGWAKQIIDGECSDDEKQLVLQEIIYRSVGVIGAKPGHSPNEEIRFLQNLAELLNIKEAQQLRFTGDGIDLSVSIPHGMEWYGPAKRVKTDGTTHIANDPVGEVYGVPFLAGFNGHITTKLPMIVEGEKVLNARIVFKDGVVDLNETHAEQGEEALKSFLKTSSGTARPGEIALASMSSYLGGLGMDLLEILLNEKMRAHLALGKIYPVCLPFLTDDSDTSLKDAGVNYDDASKHVDFMISDADTKVVATFADGTTLPLLTNGEWSTELIAALVRVQDAAAHPSSTDPLEQAYGILFGPLSMATDILEGFSEESATRRVAALRESVGENAHCSTILSTLPHSINRSVTAQTTRAIREVIRILESARL